MKIKTLISKKSISLILSVLMLIAAAVPMAVNADVESNANIWDGTMKEVTPENNIYTVKNGAELAWAFKNVQIKYLNDEVPTIKLANDIYLNDVTNNDWYKNENVQNWNVNQEKVIKLNINGNGHIIYGLYSKNEGEAAGLINVPSYHVTFENLGIDNAYIIGKTASAFVADEATNQWFVPAEGLDGIQIWNDISFENCFVGENVTIIGSGDECAAGGFVAKKNGDQSHQSKSKLVFKNCYSLANVSVDKNVEDTYNGVVNLGSFAGNTMIKQIVLRNCYTNYNGKMFGYITPNWSDGYAEITDASINYSPSVLSNAKGAYTTACSTDNMTGLLAAFNMENLGDAYVITEGYPTLSVFSPDGKSFAAVKSEYEKAFTGGKGTEENPYLISNKNGLRTAIGYFGLGKYYKLTNDIEVNDINNEDWKSGAEKWFSSTDGTVYNGLNGFTGAFNGSIDGNGYAVKGIYYPLISPWSSDSEKYTYYTGLVPVIEKGTIKNIAVSDSYISATCLMSNGNVSKAAYIGAVCGAVNMSATLNSITVDESVVIEYSNAINYSDSTYIGGIIANSKNANVILNNCAVSFTVKGNEDNKQASRISGLIGFWDWSCNITVSNSLSKGIPTLEWQGGDAGTYSLSNLYSDTEHVTAISELKFLKKGQQDQKKVENFNTLQEGFSSDVWYAVADKAPMLRIRGIAIADVNEDGAGANSKDLAALRKHLLGAETYKNTDINRDGSVDIRDLVSIKILIK